MRKIDACRYNFIFVAYPRMDNSGTACLCHSCITRRRRMCYQSLLRKFAPLGTRYLFFSRKPLSCPQQPKVYQHAPRVCIAHIIELRVLRLPSMSISDGCKFTSESASSLLSYDSARLARKVQRKTTQRSDHISTESKTRGAVQKTHKCKYCRS